MSTSLVTILDLIGRECPTIAIESRSVFPETVLNDAEVQFASAMTPLRRAQFAAGRACARAALFRVGRAPDAIPCDPDGVPQWPMGFVGSISHKSTESIAAVGFAREFRGIGIDLECDKAADEEVLSGVVVNRAEVDQLVQLRRGTAEIGSPSTWLFSAKEAVYKSVFPLFRTPLSWEDVEIAFLPGKLTFVPTIRDHEDLSLQGRIIGNGAWIVAISWLEDQ